MLIKKNEKTLQWETGFVTQAKEYFIALEGLPSVRVNDVIENDNGDQAIVTALHSNHVQALLLNRSTPRAGDSFYSRGEGVQFAFGEHLFGRVVNTLGYSVDGKGALPRGKERIKVDAPVRGMESRDLISKQLKTGVVLVDTLLPIGIGQRQLIIGPINSGKMSFLLDAVRGQQPEETICIYTLIGKPVTYIQDVAARLLRKGGNPHTIILAATSNEPAPVIYMAPSAAFSIAEYFAGEGRDVLLVLDDLGTHAKYLREIALLSGRIPGRESYPGDIFYQHAHLMERAGQFNKKHGSGSITLLPVLEIDIADTADLISTNLMAATDGHIFFSSSIHAEGYFPAIVAGQSVTRVGRQTQKKLQQDLSIRIQALLAEYEKQREFSRFGAQLSEETRNTIRKGELLEVLLEQEPSIHHPIPVQLVLLSLVFSIFCTTKSAETLRKNKQYIVAAIMENKKLSELYKTASRGNISLDQFIKRLDKEVAIFESVCQQ